MERLTTGSVDHLRAANAGLNVENIIANDTALNPRKGISRLAGTGNLTGLTLAAPTIEGFEKEITNAVAFTAVVTVAGTDVAAANVFSFPVAGATVLGPTLMLKAINVTPTAATKSLKWSVRSSWARDGGVMKRT